MIGSVFKHKLVVVLSLAVTFLAAPSVLAVSKGKGTVRYKYDYLKVKPFNTLEVSTRLNIELKHSDQYQVIIKSPKGQHTPLDAKSKNHRLTLRWRQIPEHSDRVHVTVKAPNINQLIVQGRTSVTGHNLQYTDLSITNQDQGQIQLEGKIKLTKIAQHSSEPITVSMVYSPHLTIVSDGAGQIKISGTAESARASLMENAYMDSRYLRCHWLWVKTEDTASADVLATKYLAAFAYGRNNINYYKTPDFAIYDSQVPGDVLQKAYWD